MKINGPLLKGLLAKRQMKQWQLSQKIGVSDSNCSKIILGKVEVSGDMLEKIASIMGVSTDTLKILYKVSQPSPHGRRVPRARDA